MLCPIYEANTDRAWGTPIPRCAGWQSDGRRTPLMTASRGLQANVLGTFDSIVTVIAGSAPTYSLAATTAVLVGGFGLAAPAALLYCAIPMLGIAWAYSHLGRLDGAAVGIGPGGLGLGLLPMLWYWRNGGAYYQPAGLDAGNAERPESEYGRQEPVSFGSPGDCIATDF
jgi:hypothetical protein